MTDVAFTPVLEAVRATGWTSTVLDLDAVTGKAAFLDRCARALELPDWFGHNWDALADCLRDLSWLPVARGRLLLVSGWQAYAAARPDEWATAQQVFAEAEAYWNGRAEGFAVLLTVAGGPA
ncbi:barstar family protein [Streptomyces odontomachi]|uniref:barstar family protein n=1 Tax=Streptomyces odontomachi TaxID=2944940 RepID=UPI00210E74D5|nr:barstar family protein [Streptomyces sp. ODS25]